MKLFNQFLSEITLENITKKLTDPLNEVSDESNIRIRWQGDDVAQFEIDGNPYTAGFDAGEYADYTISFQGRDQNGRMTYNKTKGGNAAAVISAVLTATREFIERFHNEHDVKPFKFEFTAAIERVNERDFPSAEEYKKELKRAVSRPKLYKRAADRMGAKHGYDVEMNTSGSPTGGGTVSFELTLHGAHERDYENINGLSIENVDDAEPEQIEAWINEDREREILAHADWSTLVRIAEWGYMHDMLIYNDDEDVRNAVINSDPDMAEKLVGSSVWEHRKHAAEMGHGIDELVSDSDEDVREAAWQYASEKYDAGEKINLAHSVNNHSPSLFDDVLDHFIDNEDNDELRIFAAEQGHRIYDLLRDDDGDVREAAISYQFNNYDDDEAVDYIGNHSGHYTEENFEYVLDNMSIVGTTAGDKVKELADEHGIDVSEYFPDEDEDDEDE